jgi:hypothetical protein
MKYYSLNYNAPKVSFQEAVIQGLAPDRGLYFPERLTPISVDFFQNIENYSNEEIAFEVIQQFGVDGFEFYLKNAGMTVTEASIGFLLGNIGAIALACVALALPKLENLATQIAVITYCIPIVAIGPIIRLVVGAPGQGEPAGAAIALAALSVFFTTMIGVLTGVKSTDQASLDVVSVYGGNSWHKLHSNHWSRWHSWSRGDWDGWRNRWKYNLWIIIDRIWRRWRKRNRRRRSKHSCYWKRNNRWNSCRW